MRLRALRGASPFPSPPNPIGTPMPLHAILVAAISALTLLGFLGILLLTAHVPRSH